MMRSSGTLCSFSTSTALIADPPVAGPVPLAFFLAHTAPLPLPSMGSSSNTYRDATSSGSCPGVNSTRFHPENSEESTTYLGIVQLGQSSLLVALDQDFPQPNASADVPQPCLHRLSVPSLQCVHALKRSDSSPRLPAELTRRRYDLQKPPLHMLHPSASLPSWESREGGSGLSQVSINSPSSLLNPPNLPLLVIG